MNDDLVLAPEVQARRALRKRRLRMHVLVPAGAWFGCGTLRVLRLKMNDDDSTSDDRVVEMTVGYESYQP